jgi:hypothetical protein
VHAGRRLHAQGVEFGSFGEQRLAGSSFSSVKRGMMPPP